jgi:hypothetical protein
MHHPEIEVGWAVWISFSEEIHKDKGRKQKKSPDILGTLFYNMLINIIVVV